MSTTTHKEIEETRRGEIFQPGTAFRTAVALNRTLVKYEYPDDLPSWSWLHRFPGYVAHYSTRDLYFVAPFDPALFESLFAKSTRNTYTYTIFRKGVFVGGNSRTLPTNIPTPPCTRSLCHVYVVVTDPGSEIRDVIPI